MVSRKPQGAKLVLRELKKHAERDNCYGCKEILRLAGVEFKDASKRKKG